MALVCVVGVGLGGDVVGRGGSGGWVEVEGGPVRVFVDSVPSCNGDGVNPSWSFASASSNSREASASPAVCEGNVVGEVVVVRAKYVPQ